MRRRLGHVLREEPRVREQEVGELIDVPGRGEVDQRVPPGDELEPAERRSGRSPGAARASALAWRAHAEHSLIRDTGRARWYDWYEVIVTQVGRNYQWPRP